MAGVTSKVPLV